MGVYSAATGLAPVPFIALSLAAKLTAQDISKTVFAHPTLSEGFQEVMRRSLVVEKSRRNA